MTIKFYLYPVENASMFLKKTFACWFSEDEIFYERAIINSKHLIYFFWLDPKEPKSQERKDIQHFSFVPRDLDAVLL